MPETKEKEIKFRLTPIANGTVLDHLPVGSAPKLVNLLDLDVSSGAITIAINTESKDGRERKDLLFIENMELTPIDLEKIGLIAHGSTWNLIKNKQVVHKQKIPLPSQVKGVMHCQNPICITNAEPITTQFVILEKPLEAVCYYCERTISEKDLLSSLKWAK
ncbi:aspartate carbamoyltransferase regulatory subunit [Candidatus Micrarchaeota archaeon]|nr:aspartate carbamoyltransferase regulatory subunit [Candidatus Micrarchaeota archaeon]MBU1930081.1 aspartate carbamoyltransferase regulatory subunit [Candidatus Micrarchaeota archaeon]